MSLANLFQRKFRGKSMQLAAKTSFMHFLFQSSFKNFPPFSTTLPFYLVVYSHLFPIPITCFQHLKSHLLAGFYHAKHLFSIEMKTHNPQLSVYFYAFGVAFCRIQPCVLLQNALRFAAKWLAFRCKLRCILHHIAGRFGANCSFSAQFVLSLCILMLNHLLSATTFLVQTKPSRESIFCGRVRGWWRKRHS